MRYQNKVITTFLVILILIDYLVYYKDKNKSTVQPFSSNFNIKEIKLRNEPVFYLKAKVWGVSGNHTRILLSKKPDNDFNNEQDIVFYTDIIFYRISLNQDSLIIYAESCSISNVTRNFSDKIKIIELNCNDQVIYYRKNYGELNLKKISVYDSLH